jgi:hypothetical protein
LTHTFVEQERTDARRARRIVTAVRGAGPLPGRLLTAAAALASLLAVLTLSKGLAVAAVTLAGLLLVRNVVALLRALVRPLAPLAAPLRRAAAILVGPAATAVRWTGARMDRARERITEALLALDRRLGEPVGSLARRVPPVVRTALLCVPRFNAWLAVVIATLVVLAGAVVVVSGWLGSALAGRTEPIAAEWLYAGALATATVVTLVIAFWIGALGRLLFLRHWRKRTCLTAGLVAVLAVIGLLSTPEVPGELNVEGERGKLEGGRPVDVLVVVDPADPAAQELAGYVRSDIAALAAQRPGALPYEVALGLATPVDPALGAGAGEWTVVEPPTFNRRHFLDSVAAVAPRAGGVTADHAALLERLRDPGFLQWHRDSRRTVALVLSELPAGAPAPLADFRAARVLVFSQERRPGRVRAWRSALQPNGGALVSYRQANASLLADVEDAASGSPVTAVSELARRYSPHLRFDSDEQFFPVDVDDLLAKAKEGGHEVCDHVRLYDDCQPADDYKDLLTPLDEYIDFEGGARLGHDLVDRDVALGVRRTIYVDAIERGDRLHLAYWWFQRYNVSPWRPERNCLPGFTFAEATCFDHEGDWEGVTVTLRSARADRWELDSVSFASHKFFTRWDEGSLELAGGTHPVVYVAQGSHAAYPTRCSSDCTQKLAGSGVPEGHFDGAKDWPQNGSACCKPLPVTPARQGALWNAFPGRWGKAVCTAFVKVCSQSDGPRSPSAQRRFKVFEGRQFAGQEAVLQRHRLRYGRAG